MSYLKGQDINLGVGREGTRGTYQAPSIWVPGRTPAGVKVTVQKAQIKETTGSGVSSSGSIVTEKSAEGDLEFNLRSSSIGYFLLSLFGQVNTTTLASGVYQHVFTLLTGTPQFPTLSLGLSQNGQQDYKYIRSLVRQLEMKFTVNDLINAVASFIAADEQTVSDYSPSFASTDYFFRPFDASLKVATDTSGIAAASAMAVKDIGLTIKNNGRLNHNVSDGVTASDALATIHDISGSFTADYDGETAHDAFVAGTYQAMQIKLSRADIDLGSTNPPSLTFLMPKVSYEKYDQDRPMDDIVKNAIDFMAHFDTTAGYAIQATLVNGKANYTT